ncbi:unnamed protein product, partial [marine sediment metagenome]
NGKDYLEQCLDSIKKLDYPEDKLETIVIDNASSDDSVNFIKSNYPLVKLISNDKNMGFAFANNQAAKAANGDYIAFLNNDTRVDKNWLIELLRPIYKNKEVVASGSKVLSIDGKNIDFVGGMINFEGKGFQIDYGIPVEKGNYSQYRYIKVILSERNLGLGEALNQAIKHTDCEYVLISNFDITYNHDTIEMLLSIINFVFSRLVR